MAFLPTPPGTLAAIAIHVSSSLLATLVGLASWQGSDLLEEKFMNGYQITFFTQQDKRHHGKPLADWLLHLVKEMGLRGATLIPGSEGFGHHGRIHSAHFFELADQPLEVLVAVTAEDAERLFARLEAEGVHLFYVKTPVEFGILGDAET